MRKVFLCLVSILVTGLILVPCALAKEKPIKIGINAEITGDIPKVGEGTKYAAQMWLEDVKKAGGIKVGSKTYPVQLVIEDNEAKGESAVKANTKLVTEDGVLAIVGPQGSKQAVPAGEVANNYKTPMISPWSTNPDTTRNRPFCLSRLLPGPVSGPGGGQLREAGIQIHQGCGPL